MTKTRYKLPYAGGKDLVSNRFYQNKNSGRIVFIYAITHYTDADLPGILCIPCVFGGQSYYLNDEVYSIKDLKARTRSLSHISNTDLVRLIANTKNKADKEELFRYSRKLAKSPIKRDISPKRLKDILHEGQHKTYLDDIGSFIDSIDDGHESW